MANSKIKVVRLRPDRADLLKDRSIELMIKSKENFNESDIVHFLIDEFANKIDVENGKLIIKRKV